MTALVDRLAIGEKTVKVDFEDLGLVGVIYWGEEGWEILE